MASLGKPLNQRANPVTDPQLEQAGELLRVAVALCCNGMRLLVQLQYNRPLTAAGVLAPLSLAALQRA